MTQRRSAKPTAKKLQRAAMGASLLAMSALAFGCGVPANNTAPSTPSNATTPAASSSAMNDANSAMNSSAALNQDPVPMRVVRHGQNVTIDMFTEETMVKVSDGVKTPMWTFDGTVPGPVLNLHEGDHVTLNLHNLDPNMPHSIDLHAAMVAPNKNFVDVAPGKTTTLKFDADVPGVFMYHCATQPMALHIGMGMYGAVVVTPKGQPAPTYTIVQSEIYKNMDYQGVVNNQPQYVVFNGKSNQYMTKPLTAKVGKPITIAFVDAGPNRFSAFHVVGTVLGDVEASGNPKNHLYDVQTYTVAPGDGALLKVTFHAPGLYPFVTHAMGDAAEGAMGKISVSP